MIPDPNPSRNPPGEQQSDHQDGLQRNHHPVPLPPETKDAPLRLFFGGTFDPPHMGHTRLPALAALTLESQHNLPVGSCSIVYVPAARSPHKSSVPTPDQHRVEMLTIALQDLSQPTTVWTQELADGLLNEDQPSYWADTWMIVGSMLPSGTNRFLIGTDQALSMHLWHRYSEFWRDAVVLLRDVQNQSEHPDQAGIDAIIQQLDATGAWSEDDLDHWRTLIIRTPTIDASSTALRQRLANPETRKERTPELCPGVHQYILENDLYLDA